MTRPLVYTSARPVYLTVKAFSQRFEVSVMTIYRLIQVGQINAIRVGHLVRIPVAEVARFERESAMTTEFVEGETA